MKRFLLIATAVVALAGCAGRERPEPEVRTVEVKVPVPVPCKADVDVHDSYADAAAETAADIFEQVRALLIGRAQRQEDAAKLRGAVVGCGGSVK